MLSFETMAVTVAEADAYCSERAKAAWTGDDTAKAAALRRGQDYIAGTYNLHWTVGFENADAPAVVKFAIVEAALIEIASPGALTPSVTLGREKVLTEVKGIKWTPSKPDAKAADFLPTLATIRNLLRAVAWIDRVPTMAVI